MMFHLIDLFPPLIATILSTGCFHNQNVSSQTKIMNSEETANHPSVVPLVGNAGPCTGTFVSATTLLTAAHCLADTLPILSTKFITNEGDSIPPTKVFTFGIVGKDLLEEIAVGSDEFKTNAFKDVAILIFSKPVAPGISALVTTEPEIDAPTTLVGFGATTVVAERNPKGKVVVRGDGGGTKQEAINHASISKKNQVNGVFEVTGTSIALPGDSGGPLLVNDNQIAAVASRLLFNPADVPADEVHEFKAEELTNAYINLRHPKVLKLMERAVNEGADIPEFNAQ